MSVLVESSEEGLLAGTILRLGIFVQYLLCQQRAVFI